MKTKNEITIRLTEGAYSALLANLAYLRAEFVIELHRARRSGDSFTVAGWTKHLAELDELLGTHQLQR